MHSCSVRWYEIIDFRVADQWHIITKTMTIRWDTVSHQFSLALGPPVVVRPLFTPHVSREHAGRPCDSEVGLLQRFQQHPKGCRAHGHSRSAAINLPILSPCLPEHFFTQIWFRNSWVPRRCTAGRQPLDPWISRWRHSCRPTLNSCVWCCNYRKQRGVPRSWFKSEQVWSHL